MSSDVLSKLRPFAETNATLGSRDFRARWETWTTVNASLVDSETTRLAAAGYAGDVPAKMYRAARYYFKSRPPSLTRRPRATNSTPYIALAPGLLAAMDNHISARTRDAHHPKPALLLNDFLASCDASTTQLMTTEVERIVQQGSLDSQRALAKIKKTYKNRYFRAARSTAAVRA